MKIFGTQGQALGVNVGHAKQKALGSKDALCQVYIPTPLRISLSVMRPHWRVLNRISYDMI